MAAAALAGRTLGFDGTTARLVMDSTLSAHVVTVEVEGPSKHPGAPPFKLVTTRFNPAEVRLVGCWLMFIAEVLVGCVPALVCESFSPAEGIFVPVNVFFIL